MSAHKDVIVFDMDGVLVDVSESYRETIRATVRRFTGNEITRELIQDYKNAGGWNNDWALTQKIASDAGVDLSYDAVVAEFQRIFFGENGAEGLMMRERWIARNGLLDRLAARFHFGIFTGRLREEALITLRRFAPETSFDLIGDDDVENKKPHPEGLVRFEKSYPRAKIIYIGDTVDDARAASAARVPFIGIADRNNPRYEELVALLKAESPIAVLDSINELETVL